MISWVVISAFPRSAWEREIISIYSLDCLLILFLSLTVLFRPRWAKKGLEKPEKFSVNKPKYTDTRFRRYDIKRAPEGASTTDVTVT